MLEVISVLSSYVTTSYSLLSAYITWANTIAITNRVTSGREKWQNLSADNVLNREKAYKAAPVGSEN